LFLAGFLLLIPWFVLTSFWLDATFDTKVEEKHCGSFHVHLESAQLSAAPTPSERAAMEPQRETGYLDRLEARGGIEPPKKVLQTFALPLGDRASVYCVGSK
jgi:hypothetical protein